MIVPQVSPPAGAIPNKEYGASFHVCIGTGPVLEAVIMATTKINGSSSATNYSAITSWGAGEYVPSDLGSWGNVTDLAVNAGDLLSINVTMHFMGALPNGCFGNITITNMNAKVRDGATTYKKIPVPCRNLSEAGQSAGWYVTDFVGNDLQTLANFTQVSFDASQAYTIDGGEWGLGDASKVIMQQDGKNLTEVEWSEYQVDISHV